LLRLALRLGGRGWKVSGLLLVLKGRGFVRPVAKRLALGVAATAKCNRLAATQAVRLAVHVAEFYLSLDAQGAVIANGNLSGRHFCS
jgi:hypothetical protein